MEAKFKSQRLKIRTRNQLLKRVGKRMFEFKRVPPHLKGLMKVQERVDQVTQEAKPQEEVEAQEKT